MKFFKYAALASFLFALTVPAQAGQDILLPLAARTATTQTAIQYRTTETGMHVIVHVTAVTGGTTVTPEIDGVDYSGNIYPLLIGTAISTTGDTVIKVGPRINPVTNGAAADIVPDVYFVKLTHSAGGSYTYAVTIQRN